MSLEEKLGLSNLNKKVKNSITSKIITYSLAGTLSFGCSNLLKQREKNEIKNETKTAELYECWNKTYEDKFYNWGLNIAIDKHNQLYLINDIETDKRDKQVTILKYNNNGQLIGEFPLWKEDEVGNIRAFETELVVDNKENVYIIGPKDFVGGIIFSKLAKDGKKIWEKVPDTIKEFGSVALDKDNNIYIGGSFYDYINHPLIIKYDKDGNKIWEKTYNYMDGKIESLILDKSDNIMVAGHSSIKRARNQKTKYNMLIAKYNSDGEEIWTKHHDFWDRGTNLTIDEDGNIYVLGEDTLSKYDNNGDLLYKKVYYDAYIYHEAKMFVNENNLYVSDILGNLITFDKKGNKLNVKHNSQINKVIFDDKENLYTVGSNVDLENKIADLVVAKFSSNCKSNKKLETIDDRYKYLRDKFIIEEFADFECPYSALVTPLLKELQFTFTKGDIALIYKHSPRKSHKFAFKAAEASECARDQGKFWEYHDKLFENQDALTVPDLKQHASDLELNVEQFNECLDLGIKGKIVEKDMEESNKRNVSGVPTFFIKDTMLVGLQDYDKLYNETDKHFPDLSQIKPVEDLIQECLHEVSDIAFQYVLLQGGHYIPNKNEEYLVLNPQIEVSYWYKDGKDIIPPLENVKIEISRAIDKFLNQCILDKPQINEWPYDTYNLGYVTPHTELLIKDDSIIVNTRYRAKVRYNDKSYQLNRFIAEAELNITGLIDSGKKIVEMHVNNEDINILLLENLGYKVDIFPHDDTLIYSLTDQTTGVNLMFAAKVKSATMYSKSLLEKCIEECRDEEKRCNETGIDNSTKRDCDLKLSICLLKCGEHIKDEEKD